MQEWKKVQILSHHKLVVKQKTVGVFIKVLILIFLLILLYYHPLIYFLL